MSYARLVILPYSYLIVCMVDLYRACRVYYVRDFDVSFNVCAGVPWLVYGPVLFVDLSFLFVSA